MDRNPHRPRRDIDDDDLTSSSSDEEVPVRPDVGAAGDALRRTPLLLQGRLNIQNHLGAGEPAPHGYPRVMRPFNLWQLPRIIRPLQPFNVNQLGGEAVALRMALNRIRLAPPLQMNRLPIFVPFRIEQRVENVQPNVEDRQGHGGVGRAPVDQEPDHIPANQQIEPDRIPPINQVPDHIPAIPRNPPRDHHRPVINQNAFELNGPYRYYPRPPVPMDGLLNPRPPVPAVNLPVARGDGLHRLGDLPNIRGFHRNDIPPRAGNRRHLVENDLLRNAAPPPDVRAARNHIHQYFRQSGARNMEPNAGQRQGENRRHEGLFQDLNVHPQPQSNIRGYNRGPSAPVRGLHNRPGSSVNQPQRAGRRYSRDNLNEASSPGPRLPDHLLPNRHQLRRTYARSTVTNTNDTPSGEQAGYDGAVNLQHPDDIPVRDQRRPNRIHTQGPVVATSRTNTNNLRGLWQRGRNGSTVNPPQVESSDRGRSRPLQPPISRPKGRSLGDVRQGQSSPSCSQSQNVVASTSRRDSRGSGRPQRAQDNFSVKGVKATYAGIHALNQRPSSTKLPSTQNQPDLSQLFTRKPTVPQTKETADTTRRQHGYSRGSLDLRRDQNRPSGTHPETRNNRYDEQGANTSRAPDLGRPRTGQQRDPVANQSQGIATKTARQYSHGRGLKNLQQDRRAPDLGLPKTGQQGDQTTPNKSQSVVTKTARQSKKQPQSGRSSDLRRPTTGQQRDQNRSPLKKSQSVVTKTARQSKNQPQAGRASDLRLPTTGQQGDQISPQGVVAKTSRQSENEPEASIAPDLGLPTTGQEGDQNKPPLKQSQDEVNTTARQHSYGGEEDRSSQNHQPQRGVEHVDRSNINEPLTTGSTSNIHGSLEDLRLRDQNQSTENRSEDAVAKRKRRFSF